MASFRVLKRWSKKTQEKKGKQRGTERREREEEEETEGRGHAHARAAVTNSTS